MNRNAGENRSSVVQREKLTEQQRAEMFRLLAAHFEGVSEKQFERDLSEKNIVILIHRGQELVGFSTLLVYETSFAAESITVIYSGDTIVAPEAWGSTALFRAWINSVKAIRRDFPAGKFYWLLLTSGFRTYRLLPLFWQEFFPRFDAETPPKTKALLEYLANKQFPAEFDSDHGIVRFHQPQRLRKGLREVPIGKEADPHVAFFLKRNPFHGNGDELVCLTELSDENLTAAGKRMLR